MFSFDCAAWNPNCLVVGHAAAAWVLKDLIPGERMALLSPQVRARPAGRGLPPSPQAPPHQLWVWLSSLRPPLPLVHSPDC
jgi:hypothetical protein